MYVSIKHEDNIEMENRERDHIHIKKCYALQKHHILGNSGKGESLLLHWIILKLLRKKD